MPMESIFSSRRESWPPTQLRLTPAMSIKKRSGIEHLEPRPLLEDIDDNPLTYFLTPIPAEDEDDEMDLDVDMMDFDAGIEDASQPREAVRSVSPSSLEGLRKPDSTRPASPDFDSDALTTDDDDDEEYIRFSPTSSSFSLSPLRDLAIDGLRFRAKSPVFGLSANALLSPNSVPAPGRRGRGRTNSRGSTRQQTRSLSVRARDDHLWREPSPDVWSIEEETEEELMSDAGVDNKAAKPKKKVRFVLPDKE
ncbi:uncharacterized protein TRIVIDRAFT_51356 [Trichoderma virens Gv29-8]|uniref:Uncharacterized protein n=1 Tax=Hypocrea virens (strain Gv29-8 / FGSC 10586) TaxID=413071 RepID=G9NDV2_HYPVG|nr:uncharacterized protein TRIVIDRAFT_51356 [Trichoderma virens Gv29-8]EHK15201.1 hypothetical protein TRIVIDRAFT_51356 [Trichoderma virens Gv29-8]UKZ58040.1 hypothetical protein TrVGV298_011902 [Trichoderma virens]